MQFGTLFWNTADKNLTPLIEELLDEREIDFVAACEAGLLEKELFSAKLKRRFREVPSVTLSDSQKIRVYVSSKLLPRCQIVYEDSTGRLVIYRMILETIDFFITTIHLISKVNSEKDQSSEAQHFAAQIRATEERFGHRRTMVIGDFNMNPFESGVISAAGFHGVMDREIAKQKSRIFQSREYPFFYNPMWGCFGDRTHGPAGTHYYSSGGHCTFWNMFDQVLIRPDLLSYFQNQIVILDRVGEQRLGDPKGRPSKSIVSDHFPLCVHLTFS